jgi:hypothetical protein
MTRFQMLAAFLVTGAAGIICAGEAGEQTVFLYLGQVKPRSASEIQASNWSIGAETMDRDYTIYRNWKSYLGPLGFKKARLQAGWAKTEKEKGVYDWGWLDEISLDMVEQKVEPWMCLSYGNPVYADGGGTLLGAALPRTKEALQAWEKFVRAIVARYRHVIDEWEVWNEPNQDKGITPGLYADFLIRTAGAIRQVQPRARILTLSLAGIDFTFFAGSFDQPVYVDLRESKVWEIPPSHWSRRGTVCEFRGIPCYDSPILIADKSLIPIASADDR